MVRDPEVDRVLTAIVGAAGLRGTWAAIEEGKTVALANKETLVVAGPLVTELARKTGSMLLPVDSEHSAIFQALKGGAAKEVRRVILTSSGGPFRGKTKRELAEVTPEQALNHPTWKMGPKITIDSATLMNKALEVIEARWLFDLKPEQIEVVIHPESVVHSMVEFVDGSVIAQLSPPDMRLPVQYALTYPDRVPGPCPLLDLTKAMSLHFEPPDRETFPGLDLGFEVMGRGGTAGAALNAANEVAVQRFLDGEIAFLDIPRACRSALDYHTFDTHPSLDDLWKVDAWARQEVSRWRR
jgi:1-deoxy-D-xylulose-5-phosphate reductoisomerase